MNTPTFILDKSPNWNQDAWFEQVRHDLLKVPTNTFDNINIPSLPDTNPLEEYFFKVTSNTQK